MHVCMMKIVSHTLAITSIVCIHASYHPLDCAQRLHLPQACSGEVRPAAPRKLPRAISGARGGARATRSSRRVFDHQGRCNMCLTIRVVAELPRDGRSVPWALFPLCFGVPIAEALEIFSFFPSVCNRAENIAQTPEQIFFRKLCHDLPIFPKLVFFRGLAAFSVLSQTLCKQQNNRAFQTLGPRNRGKMASIAYGKKNGEHYT